MEDRTYPREWFRTTNWSDEPESRMFDRETEHMLFSAIGFVRKRNARSVWYPTWEEAQAAISDRIRREKDRRASRRLAKAAPDLLEALQEYMSQFGQALDANDIAYGPAQVAADEKARAAIAKATEPEAS